MSDINREAAGLLYCVAVKLRSTFEGAGVECFGYFVKGSRVCFTVSNPELCRSIMDGLGMLGDWSAWTWGTGCRSLEVEPVLLRGLVSAADSFGVPVPVSLRCFRSGVPLTA